MARRVDERHGPILHGHDVGADALRDAARFSRNHIRLAESVQETCLAVVDVAHNCDDWRPRLQRVGIVLVDGDARRQGEGRATVISAFIILIILIDLVGGRGPLPSKTLDDQPSRRAVDVLRDCC